MHAFVHHFPHLGQTHLFGIVAQIEGSADVVFLPSDLFVSHIVFVLDPVAPPPDQERVDQGKQREQKKDRVDHSDQNARAGDVDDDPDEVQHVIHRSVRLVGRRADRLDVVVVKRRILVAREVHFRRFSLQKVLKIGVHDRKPLLIVPPQNTIKDEAHDPEGGDQGDRDDDRFDRFALLQGVQGVFKEIGPEQKRLYRRQHDMKQRNPKKTGARLHDEPDHISVVLESALPAEFLLVLFIHGFYR